MKWQNAINTVDSKEEVLQKKVSRAIQSLTEHFTASALQPVCLLSGGKDSTTTTSLSLVAWKNAIKRLPNLRKIPFIIAYSDTRCEMPIKANYLETLINDFKQYALKHDFNLKVIIAQPSTVASWQCKIIGGYAVQWDCRLSVGHGCASDWKIEAIKRALKPYETAAKQLGLTFTRILGSRYQESTNRSINLDKVGANEFEIIKYKGQTKLYPVYSWSVNDIWDYLLFCEQDEDAKMEGAKDAFYSTLQFYNELGGNECSAGVIEQSSCAGSRDGCWNCFASTKEYLDKGLYESNPHLAALGEFRRFMLANNIDAYNRSHIPHTPSNYTRYRASCHSGSYLLDMLRIGLTIQVREQERANREREMVEKGIHIDPSNARTEAEFVIFTPKDIAFIDYSWQSRGLQLEPNMAVKTFYEITYLGARYDIPNGYVRNTSQPEEKPATLGNIFFPGLNTNDTDSIELDEELERGWKFADDVEFESMFNNKALLETWLENDCFLTGASRWLESGLITPPKHQLKNILKRNEWVKNIYATGLNKMAFHGGKLG